jgi:pyrimidine-nucleoside phosphorylase
MHAVDLIRKTRDGEPLRTEEIQFLVAGAADGSIAEALLAAWLMAVFQRGLTLPELSALTEAMRFSGETFDARDLGRKTVDKHSTGGVGDKTSFLVAPIAAAAGLLDPMISGRALGHTGGTLDKLETIPGFRTSLSLAEMRSTIAATGACLVGQTAALVPADRTLYALRDRTATVESPYLICASIMSKKLAAGLDALVLDVKTGSGAFLSNPAQARFLAELMVETGERSGTRTAALLTDMSQPLGASAGNWLEIAECCALLQGERPTLSEDLRTVSLELAAWMLFLGGAEPSVDQGRARAAALLTNGEAWQCFRQIVAAQAGDIRVLDSAATQHAPGAQTLFRASRSGYLSRIDTTAVGWAVQRLGAGRVRAGEPIDPQAGLVMHAKLGEPVKAGEPICTLFAASDSLFAEPLALLGHAVIITEDREEPPPLLGEVLTRSGGTT